MRDAPPYATVAEDVQPERSVLAVARAARARRKRGVCILASVFSGVDEKKAVLN